MNIGELLQTLLSLLSGTLRVFIPIAFAALAFMFAAQAGIINMALDGTMLFAAFFGVYGSYITGNAWIGLLFAVVSGILVSLFLGLLTVNFKCPQMIAGLGINLLARGLTIVFLQAVWNAKGKSTPVTGLGVIHIAFLENVPILNKLIGDVSPLLLILLLCLALVWFLIKKTPFGLRLRTIGENPVVAASQGIDVYKMQYIGIVISGILAALGGAFLSIGDINIFSRDMVAGRGFIGIAVCIFGGYEPFGLLLGSLLFGFAQSLQYRIQNINIPSQLVQILPYVLTMLALALKRKSGLGPSSAGVPYEKEGQ